MRLWGPQFFKRYVCQAVTPETDAWGVCCLASIHSQHCKQLYAHASFALHLASLLPMNLVLPLSNFQYHI